MPLAYKVFNQSGSLIASVHHLEDALQIVSGYDFASIRHHGLVVWREGQEDFSAYNRIGATLLIEQRIAAESPVPRASVR